MNYAETLNPNHTINLTYGDLTFLIEELSSDYRCDRELTPWSLLQLLCKLEARCKERVGIVGNE